MARKKSGLKPETLDDGGLFGDIELVYEEAKENAKTSNVSNTPKDVSVTETLALDTEDETTAEGAATKRSDEVEVTETDASDVNESTEANDEESADEASSDALNGADETETSASPLGNHVDDVMTGDAECDGQLTLARYASRAYLEYAMSVVKSRALPDVSDGQKPVQRRILIDMERMGVKAGAKAVKSARVVGDVLGKYHPHGDQSVYDALVRMAQHFSLRYPLIDGEGNFGSRDGDSQAAMRYTEARLMPIAQLLLDEVDTGAIDFTPNYDGNFQEPVVLPAKLPFVLLNGSSGIAVGITDSIFRPTT